MNPILLHISDLHFGWGLPGGLDETVKNDFLEDLKTVDPKPNFVVVSGDLSNFARQPRLEDAMTFLQDVSRICNLPNDSHIIIVPGNHDMGFFTRFFSVNYSLRRYKNQFGESSLLRFYPNYRIAFLCLNSNVIGWVSKFVGGKIGDDRLGQLRTEYNISMKEHGASFGSSVKIAILHHHPLPVPNTKHNNFDVLRDAADFLTRLTDFEFDMILHGHKHSPNIARAAYLSKDKLQHEILVVSSGTVTSTRTAKYARNHYSLVEIGTNYIGSSIPVTVQWRVNYEGTFRPYSVPSFSFRLRERDDATERQTGVRLILH